MKTWSVLALGAVLFTFTPAFADDTPAAASSTTAAPAKDDGDEMICHREKLTGTNLLGPKICKPKKLWQQQHQDSQDTLNQQTQKALLNQPPGG